MSLHRQGYAEVRIVHVMLDVTQPIRDQSWDSLLSSQNNLCPWLQIQNTEVGLTAKRRNMPSINTVHHIQSEFPVEEVGEGI